MEHVDVLDEKGRASGLIDSIAQVHKKGLWHRAVHVWFLNSREELLLQLRSKNSFLAPNFWDISAAGHVSAGTTSLEAALKETEEELGVRLKPEQLEHLAELKEPYKGTEYINNEFCDIYLVKIDVGVNDFVFKDGEVEAVQWVHWQELEKWVAERKSDLVEHPEEYKLLFAKIKNNGKA